MNIESVDLRTAHDAGRSLHRGTAKLIAIDKLGQRADAL